MLVLLTFKCPCGYKFSTCHVIKNDEFLESLKKSKQQCPRCTLTLIPTVTEKYPPYYSLSHLGDNQDTMSLMFLEHHEVILLQKDKISINLESLIKAGFPGTIEIYCGDEKVESINIDTINNLYQVYKRKRPKVIRPGARIYDQFFNTTTTTPVILAERPDENENETYDVEDQEEEEAE